jgi:hypothetical protein
VPHEPNSLTAELYCLNVYSSGGHFEPHKDTPRGDDMLGTLVESCADQTWQLRRFPTARERDSLDDRIDAYELEEALPVQLAADSPEDFKVRWVVPPPEFNFALQKPAAMSTEQTENPTPNRPAVQHFHGCEYSATGYFGNEGGDTDFYVYAALHADWPRWTERKGRKTSAPSDTRTTRRAR